MRSYKSIPLHVFLLMQILSAAIYQLSPRAYVADNQKSNVSGTCTFIAPPLYVSSQLVPTGRLVCVCILCTWNWFGHSPIPVYCYYYYYYGFYLIILDFPLIVGRVVERFEYKVRSALFPQKQTQLSVRCNVETHYY